MAPGALYQKVEIAKVVADLGLPNLKVFPGVWHETTFISNRFGLGVQQGKVEIVGTGDEPVSRSNRW